MKTDFEHGDLNTFLCVQSCGKMVYLSESERLEIIAGCLAFIIMCFVIMVCKLSPLCCLNKYCPCRAKYDEEYAIPLNGYPSFQQTYSTYKHDPRLVSHRYMHRRDPYTSSGDSSDSETEAYINREAASFIESPLKSPDGENDLGTPTGRPYLVRGEIELSLFYPDEVEDPKHLNIRIYKVTNLIFRRCEKVKLGIKIQLLKEEKNLEKVLTFFHLVEPGELDLNVEFETQTSLKSITKKLEWEEVKLIPLPKSATENRCLRFVCCLYDRYSQVTQLGECIVSCKHVTFRDDDVIQKPLAATLDEARGEVLLSLSYLPTAQKLIVQPVECRQLKLFDISFPSSVYLRIALMSKGTYVKKRTCLLESQSRLIWNDPVNFDLRISQLKNINLLITVKQSIAFEDDIKVKDVGKFVVGVTAGTTQAREQWRQMMQHPRQIQAVWHSVY